MDTTHIRVMNPIDQRTWRTLAEAANLLDISRVSVFCAVRDGRLAGGYMYEGGPIIIELAALEQYRPRRKNRQKLATIEKRTGPSGDLH